MHERISINSVCFGSATLPEQAGYWRKLGNRRVGLSGHQLVREGVAAAQDAVTSTGCKVDTIVHSSVMGPHVQADPATWEEPRARLNRAIDWAKTLGARTIYMTTGGHGTLTWEQAAEAFSAAIAPCLPKAEAVGVKLLIELTVQMNADLHIVHNLHDATLLAEMAGIGVNIDLFAAWQEAGLRETFKRVAPRCHLVQVSDYVYGDRCTPSRAVPGDGCMPLKRLLDWLLSDGFSGGFDLELLGPRIDKEGHFAAAQRAGEKTSELLQSLGA
jgi:sugar phosphate isomerase/epimerase